MSEFIAQHFVAFGGARCQILAQASHADISAAIADAYNFEERLSRFRSDSELSRFNASAGRRRPVSPLLEALLRQALHAYAISEGMVNTAVHHALVAAGYDRSFPQLPSQKTGAKVTPTGVPPLPEILTVGRGWARLKSGHALDLGGIGKGWLADCLAERFDNAVVNLGGDIRAVGRGYDDAGWRVRIDENTEMAITDAGVGTSSKLRRRWRGGHHLIDPRSGEPSPSNVVSATVVAGNCLHAEVMAKAAILLGREKGSLWLAKHGAIRGILWPYES